MNVIDKEILELLGVLADDNPTLAGLLTFPKYPQGCFPQLCITAVRCPILEIGEVAEERFIENVRITGTNSNMLSEIVGFVRKNCRHETSINESGQLIDKSEYPFKVVREAILNALVHRDYSVHTENVLIRLEMYSDRMEIISSGGLYGKITIDSLGKVRPDTRNAVFVNMLEVLRITEKRYSGMPIIRNEFKNT